MSSAKADNRASNAAFLALLCILFSGVCAFIGYGTSLPIGVHYLVVCMMYGLPFVAIFIAVFTGKPR